MSVRVMTWVWDHSQSKKTDRLVLLAIADCASDDGSNAYPSMAELVRKTGLTDRGVQKAMARLIELGELLVSRNGGPKGCNRYRVTMRTPEPGSPPNAVHPPNAVRVNDVHPPNTVRRTPEHGSPPPPNAVRVTPERRSPGTVLEPSIEPSIEPSTTPPAAAEVIDAEIVDMTPLLPVPAQPENAGQINRQWIDHCTANGVKLTDTLIKRYGAGIASAMKQGFDPNLIKTALGQMLTDRVASRPALLDNYLVRAQQGPELPPRRMTRGEAGAARHAPAGSNVGALIHDALTRPA